MQKPAPPGLPQLAHRRGRAFLNIDPASYLVLSRLFARGLAGLLPYAQESGYRPDAGFLDAVILRSNRLENIGRQEGQFLSFRCNAVFHRHVPPMAIQAMGGIVPSRYILYVAVEYDETSSQPVSCGNTIDKRNIWCYTSLLYALWQQRFTLKFGRRILGKRLRAL